MNCTATPNIKACSPAKTDYKRLVKRKIISKQEADICIASERNGFNVQINFSCDINPFDSKVEIVIEKKRSVNHKILYVADRKLKNK